MTMSQSGYVTKGTRIRARWTTSKPVSLSGAQMKFEAQVHEIIGVVRHVRGDHPTDPTRVGLFIKTADGQGQLCEKCGVWEVVVDPKHVIEVLP